MSGKLLVGSVLMSVILTSGVCIFLVPITTPAVLEFFPDLKEEDVDLNNTIADLREETVELNHTIADLNSEIDELKNEIEQFSDDGIILQSVVKQFYSEPDIFDSVLTNTEIPDTNATFSIRNQSKIFVIFSSYSRIGFASGVTNYLSFNVTLSVEGIGNSSLKIGMYQYSSTIDRTFPYHIYLIYETDPLPAGDYTIKAFYKSNADITGFNNYLLLSQGGEYNPRSLIIQEIKAN
ncbi:MAG: hypothetical protein ACW967_10890 [Candidatus Hodarchaeales archaeon]